ncbi:hypothetical protein AWM75_02915 [Aerococcus urinaehominis]|uniref:Uncharacterized protein n=1 Tax=Aerococcus urinaehominis TaxID=128944 RepID=A0A109RHL0_9LACT|nr:nuclease-related domain-containing protein [Aerococcus urinaehominis]AMB99011.1 hypothetical protein AWM75_02915 [Aerococcus urinaehominis]SDM57091.1 Nuclease-related domain-containing protein [Aerococcus urinaehominis]
MYLELAWHEACHKRQGLDEQGYKHLLNLRAGLEGELLLEDILSACLPTNNFLTNVWLGHDRQLVQLDGLVVNAGQIYVLEVKNYSVDHQYMQGQWLRAGQPVDYDPFKQLQRAVGVLRQRLKGYQVHGVLIFTNSSWSFTSNGDEPWGVFNQSSLKNWLNNLSEPSSNDFRMLHDIKNIAGSELAAGYFYRLEPNYPLITGIYCKVCGNFELKLEKMSAICSCGYREKKKDLTARMLDEYALLFYQNHIHPSHFFKFVDHNLPRKTCFYALSSYEKVRRGVYLNPYGKFLTKAPRMIRPKENLY